MTPRTDRAWALAAAALVFLASFAYFHAARPDFTGDEPHYAVYARSIGAGWGLDLERAYLDENTAPIYGGPLGPHGRRYAGPDERLASWHGVGLPVLLAPAVAAHPSPWTARHVMLLVDAVLAYHLVLLCRRVTRCPPRLAALGTVALLLAPPLLYYSGLVFPEVPAALLVVLSLRAWLVAGERRPGAAVGASIAAGLLPWLGIRYGILSAGLLATYWVVELRRRRPGDLAAVARLTAPLAIPAGVLGLALVAFNLELFGAISPPQDLAADDPYYRPQNVYIYGVGGLLGFPSGIIPLAPLLLVPLAALAVAAQRLGAAVVAVAATAGAYVTFNGYFGSPGFCPPGRYLVTVVPLLAVPLVVALVRGGRLVRGTTAALGALTVLSAVTSISDFNRLFTGDRDGFEPIAATAELWPYSIEDRRPSSWAAGARWLQSGTGVLEGDDVLVAREGRDASGPLVFGPYVHLQPGRYVVRYPLDNRGGERVDAAVDVASPALGTLTSKPVALPARTGVVETLEFETDGDTPMEFRVYWSGEGTLSVSGMSADLLEPLPARRTRAEWWKAALWVAGLSGAAAAWWRTDRRRETASMPERRELVDAGGALPLVHR